MKIKNKNTDTIQCNFSNFSLESSIKLLSTHSSTISFLLKNTKKLENTINFQVDYFNLEFTNKKCKNQKSEEVK